jgi:hypothetical protein
MTEPSLVAVIIPYSDLQRYPNIQSLPNTSAICGENLGLTGIRIRRLFGEASEGSELGTR